MLPLAFQLRALGLPDGHALDPEALLELRRMSPPPPRPRPEPFVLIIRPPLRLSALAG